MKLHIFSVIMGGLILLGSSHPIWAEDINSAKNTTDVQDIGEVTVSAKKEKKDIRLEPSEIVIRPDDMNTAGNAQNVTGLILKLPMFDNRGTSSLVPDVDSLYMRGFDGTRFSTAIDGMNIRKTGGRKASNIVDYGLLPPWLFGEIQVLPGPHSAAYPAKSIGGVLNLIPKAPEEQDSLIPETQLDLGFESYGTQNDTLHTHGSAGHVTYDLGYQKYLTNGYLRHTDATMDTFVSRIGYLLPSNGFITVSFSHTDTDKNTTVVNDPANATSEYDPGYPIVNATTFFAYQEPTWDGEADSYRFILHQPSALGSLSAQAFYSKESRNYHYLTWVSDLDHSLGKKDDPTSFETTWAQQGGKIQDTIPMGQSHVFTLGTDLEQCFDDGTRDKKLEKRIDIMGGYIEDTWKILNGLTLKTGLRYEDVDIRISNISATGHYITGKGDWVDRHWNTFLPKSFITWELDSLSHTLRDTSISAGLSKVWRAPDYHGNYNPQGRPAGAWLEPEHGYGSDLIFTRRLFSDIHLKLDYAYYEIKDYITSNKAFATYTPSNTNPVTPGMEFMDYQVNLGKVIQQTMEIQMNGHLMKDLSFYLGYAFLDMDSKGGEPAGETACDRRARHRVNAGLDYELFPQTTLILDYRYQAHQIMEVSQQITQDEWTFSDVLMDSWQVFDVAVRQEVLMNMGPLKKGNLKVYVKNLLDETYLDSSGFPATDRTYGTSLSLMF